MLNTAWYNNKFEIKNHIKSFAYMTEEDRGDCWKNKELLPYETFFIVGSYVKIVYKVFLTILMNLLVLVLENYI